MSEVIEGWILEKSVSADPHLRQGDLVWFRESEDPMRTVGVVVTADCDLENRKHAQLVTLVPLLSVQVILERYLFLEACASHRSSIRAYLYKKYGIDNLEESLVADVKLREILKDSAVIPIDAIAVNLILGLQDHITVYFYRDLMRLIGCSAKGGGSFDSQLKNRGDLVVLPSAEKLKIKQRIAWVRHLWQVPVGDIALRTSGVKYSPGEFVARLDSPYRYRLTQVMSQVFSDIGLPTVNVEFLSEIEKVMSDA